MTAELICGRWQEVLVGRYDPERAKVVPEYAAVGIDALLLERPTLGLER